MKLILVRHGQTEDNLTGTIQGHLPGKLTKLGIKQARKVGQNLADIKLDAIYSSDLRRAVDTAKQITPFHKAVSITFTEDLRERYFGSLEGKRRKDLQGDVINLNPPDAESIEESCERAKKLLRQVYATHMYDTVLFVTHGFFSKCLLAALQNTDANSVKAMDHFGNASISMFEVQDGLPLEVLSINVTDHLDD